MEITRYGSDANRGVGSVVFKSPEVRWSDYEEGVLEITQERARDFSSRTDHNYHVTLSAAECGLILDAMLAGLRSKQGNELLCVFSDRLHELQRVVATCIKPLDVPPLEAKP